MSGVLILTISGRDRAGLVEKLADLIAEHGGNWEHCRMAHLAGRFVGLLEVTVTGNEQQDLESA
jgi:glycine cleavage system regulatory protein